MEFIDVKWFTSGMGSCGIVKGISWKSDNIKYYIGNCTEGNSLVQICLTPILIAE